jgi:hypothetical protein
MPQTRLLVAVEPVEPVDFRRGIDGLVAVCRQRLQADPMSGALFIFGSRNRKSIKILAYDGQGLTGGPAGLLNCRCQYFSRHAFREPYPFLSRIG